MKIDMDALVKKIKEKEAAIQTVRDELGTIIDEATGLQESCDRAIDGLQSAFDALSELV